MGENLGLDLDIGSFDGDRSSRFAPALLELDREVGFTRTTETPA